MEMKIEEIAMDLIKQIKKCDGIYGKPTCELMEELQPIKPIIKTRNVPFYAEKIFRRMEDIDSSLKKKRRLFMNFGVERLGDSFVLFYDKNHWSQEPFPEPEYAEELLKEKYSELRIELNRQVDEIKKLRFKNDRNAIISQVVFIEDMKEIGDYKSNTPGQHMAASNMIYINVNETKLHGITSKDKKKKKKIMAAKHNLRLALTHELVHSVNCRRGNWKFINGIDSWKWTDANEVRIDLEAMLRGSIEDISGATAKIGYYYQEFKTKTKAIKKSLEDLENLTGMTEDSFEPIKDNKQLRAILTKANIKKTNLWERMVPRERIEGSFIKSDKSEIFTKKNNWLN